MLFDVIQVDFLAVALICVLVFLAGFVDSIAGGGGLISLPAYLIAGLPVHNALATNKMSSCMGTAVATLRYAKSGFIPWKQAVFCIFCAFAGGSSGALLALAVPEQALLILMLITLPVLAAYVMKGQILADDKPVYSECKTTIIGMASAFAIGVYDGMYGPGTGTFLILCLTVLAHMPLVKANGLTKAINLSTNVSSLVVFLLNGKTLICLGVVAGLFNMAGNFIGASVFKKTGALSVRPLMVFVLIVFFIKVFMELFC